MKTARLFVLTRTHPEVTRIGEWDSVEERDGTIADAHRIADAQLQNVYLRYESGRTRMIRPYR